MNDPYKEMNLERDASPEEVTAAYRRESSKRHPDREGGSEEAFKALGAAYEILSDPEKRRAFDEFGDTTGSEAQARGVLRSIFQQFLSTKQPGDPLTSIAGQLEIGKTTQEGEIERFERMAKKLKSKKGHDTLGAVLTELISVARNNLVVIELAQRLLEEGWEFEADVVLSGPSIFMNSFSYSHGGPG